jgi:polysaccharide deacetylase 2 family uncharacterized protein YibQ
MAIRRAKLPGMIVVMSVVLFFMLGYLFFISEKIEHNRALKLSKRIVFVIEDTEDNTLKVQDSGKPIITIVLDGIGLVNGDIPKEIAIGVPSDLEANKLSDSLKQHALILNIPVEPFSDSDDEHDSHILLKDDDNSDKLNVFLEKAKNYKAIYSSDNDNFTNSYKEAENLIANFRDRKIIYLSGLADKKSPIYEVANKMHYFILENDVVIDAVISRDEIITKLLELEKIAKQNGYAVGFASAYPLTIEMLNEWVSSLSEKGIELLPIEEFYSIAAKRKKF